MTGVDVTGRSRQADSHAWTVPALVTQSFDRQGLFAVRSAVAQAAGLVGLSVMRVADLLLVVSELTTNAVCHGGGSGHLELWSVNNRLHCLVTDQGPGIPPERANIADVPLALELSGRGIWLARKLADSLSITSSPAGTAIHITIVI